MHSMLAAIFKYDSLKNKYLCDAITIVLVDEDDNYMVKIGDYTGYDNSTIKRIVDIENNNFDEIEIKNDNKRYAIFLFDNKKFEEIQEESEDKSKISAIRKIREALQHIELVNVRDNVYKIIKLKKNVSYVSLADVFSVRKFWIEDKDNFIFDNELEVTNVFKSMDDNENNEYKEMKYKKDLDFNMFNTYSAFKFIPSSLLDSDDLCILNEDDTKKDINEFKHIDILEIINSISKKIVGQDDAIKTIVTNIYYNQVLLDSVKETEQNELESRKVSILLDGPTGTGKTAILKEIANKFDLPITIVNANSFSETGYVGPTITDTLKDLIKKSNGDIDKAERGIIVLDEVDKIASNPNPSGKDMKKIVQEELLGFISGGTYSVDLGKNPMFNTHKEISTNKITFILSGAFTNLREDKIKEINSHSIGFSGSEEKKENTYVIDVDDYIEYGLLREFFGRIKVLTNTKGYTKDDLKNILLNSEISPLKNFEKTVKMFKYKGIKYSDEFIERLCDEAYNHNTGARALQTYMSGIQNIMLQDLITRKYPGDEVFLDESLLDSYDKKKVRSF